MSTYYAIRCVQCKDGTDHEFRPPQYLFALLDHREELENIARDKRFAGMLEIYFIGQESESWHEFFGKHLNHELFVENEYGETIKDRSK